MKEKLARFMLGRYGVDQFSRFLLGVALVTMIISRFFGGGVLYTISFLSLIFCYYRILSKNHNRRYMENNKYLKLKNKFLGFFKKQKNIAAQRKTHRIYHCPSCRQKIRVPKGKGRISITCPKCHIEFIKKS